MLTDQNRLFWLVLFLMAVVVVTALGGGLFHQPAPWYLQWQHQAFSGLCHQIPERSFWINGQPMAVCSRCFGIYAGFFLGWMLLPMQAVGKWTTTWPIKQLVLVTVLINFFDIVGNMLGFWENTLVSRLALGCILGWTSALIFSGDFFKTSSKQIENHHGRITADI